MKTQYNTILILIVINIGICIVLFYAGADKIAKTKTSYHIIKPEYDVRYFPKVTMTAYTASEDETNENPEKTAIMESPIPGWTCAVSRDFIQFLGDRIYIEGIGVRKVNDLMNVRYTKRIDILVGTKRQAYRIGKQSKAVIFLP